MFSAKEVARYEESMFSFFMLARIVLSMDFWSDTRPASGFFGCKRSQHNINASRPMTRTSDFSPCLKNTSSSFFDLVLFSRFQ